MKRVMMIWLALFLFLVPSAWAAPAWLEIDSTDLAGGSPNAGVNFCGQDSSSYSIERALDGSNDGAWTWRHADHGGGPYHWFIIDFGAEYTLSKFHSHSRTPRDPTVLAIYIWATNLGDNYIDWINAGALATQGADAGDDLCSWQETGFSPKDGQFAFVRVTADESAGTRWGFAGCGGDFPAGTPCGGCDSPCDECDAPPIFDFYGELAGQPEAAFSGTPLSGAINLEVTFTDESTETPTDWDWDFGDTGTSTEQHPVHTYETVDSFTVTLTVLPGGDDEEKIDYVTTSDATERTWNTPGALENCKYDPTEITGMDLDTDVNATCKYDDEDVAYDSMDGGIFGDGTMSGAGTTDHTEPMPGTYACGSNDTIYVRCMRTSDSVKDTISESNGFSVETSAWGSTAIEPNSLGAGNLTTCGSAAAIWSDNDVACYHGDHVNSGYQFVNMAAPPDTDHLRGVRVWSRMRAHGTADPNSHRLLRFGLFEDILFSGWNHDVDPGTIDVAAGENYDAGFIGPKVRLPDWNADPAVGFTNYFYDWPRNPQDDSDWEWGDLDDMEIFLFSQGGHPHTDGWMHGGKWDHVWIEAIHGDSDETYLLNGPVVSFDADNPTDRFKMYLKLAHDGYVRVDYRKPEAAWAADFTTSAKLTSATNWSTILTVPDDAPRLDDNQLYEFRIQTSANGTSWRTAYDPGGDGTSDENTWEDYPTYKTLADEGIRKCIFGGDMGRLGYVPTYASIDAENPELILISGDMSWDTLGSNYNLRKAWDENLGGVNLEFRNHILMKYPLVMAYDDHDYGWGNACALSGDFAERNNPFDRYQEMRPHPGYEDDTLKMNNGQFTLALSGSVDAEFFLLDNRGGRTPNLTRGGSMLTQMLDETVVPITNSGTISAGSSTATITDVNGTPNFTAVVRVGDIAKNISHDDLADQTFTTVLFVTTNSIVETEHEIWNSGDEYEFYRYGQERTGVSGGTIEELENFRLHDNDGHFDDTPDSVTDVWVGDIVINETHNTPLDATQFALVTAIHANYLELDDTIFDTADTDTYRIYRSSKTTASEPGDNQPQRNWLVTEVNNSTADQIILISSVAFNENCDLMRCPVACAGAHGDCCQGDRYGDHDPLDALLEYLADNLVLDPEQSLYSLTADRHLAMVDNGENNFLGAYEMIAAPWSDNALSVHSGSGCAKAAHTGLDNSGGSENTDLYDASPDWGPSDNLEGWVLYNRDDGDVGIVLSNTATTVTGVTTAGGDFSWDNADQYAVVLQGWSEGCYGNIFGGNEYEYYYGIATYSSVGVVYQLKTGDGNSLAGLGGRHWVPPLQHRMEYGKNRGYEEGFE